MVGLGQVQDAELRRHGAAADVVGRAELALPSIREVGREGVGIGGRQLRGDVGPGLLHSAEAYLKQARTFGYSSVMML